MLLFLCCRYDKVKIVLKEIINCQYVACMNPTAGSFNITPRMQRQFVTLAVQMPSAEIVRSVYFQIIDGHINGFDADVPKMSTKLVDASIELHRNVSAAAAAAAAAVAYVSCNTYSILLHVQIHLKLAWIPFLAISSLMFAVCWYYLNVCLI